MRRRQTRRVVLTISENQYETLLRLAQRSRRSVSSVMREAVEEFTGVRDTVTPAGPVRKDEDAPVSTVDAGQPS